MTVDFNVNVTTLTSLTVAGIAVLTYVRGIKTHITQVRHNDLAHIDMKLDVITQRIDDLYKMIAERKI